MANSEWGRSWMVINDLMPDMEYEVRLIAKNKYGDTAASTLYRVNTQPRQGIHVQFLYISIQDFYAWLCFRGATLYHKLVFVTDFF